jgi:hypothetical protein
MLLLIKKNAIKIWITQLIIASLVLIVGLFSQNDLYSPFEYGKSVPIISVYLNIFITFPIYRNLYLDKINRYKLSFSFITVFFLLTSFYNIYLIIIDYDVFPETAILYFLFQSINTLIGIILLLLFSILIFISPSYINNQQIQRNKLKKASSATLKIRQLKKLLDEGIISKEVFDEKSKKYIEEL